MKKQNMKKLFEEDCQRIMNDLYEKKKAASLLQLNKAVNDKRIVPVISKREVFRTQFKYMNKSIFIIQLVLLFIVSFLISRLNSQNFPKTSLFITGSVLAALLGTLTAIACSGVCFTGMSELSNSCYFNIKQNTILNIIVYSSVDLIILSAAVVLLYRNSGKSLLETVLYVLVPFILSNCVYLKIMMTEPGRKNNYILAGAGIMMSALFTVCGMEPKWYEKAALGGWLVLLTAGLFLLFLEIYDLFIRIDKGEILCTH